MIKQEENTAYLSSKGQYISFTYKDKAIRFMGPINLQYIVRVKIWDKGYIVVDVKYSNSKEDVEDYIDLISILERLYINTQEFLEPIKNVEVRY